jgi:hypothetical protein
MRYLTLVLLAVFSLTSCKETPTDPEPDDTVVRWTMPKAGAQFKMAIVTTDSGWNVDTFNEIDIFKILQVNIPWAGRDSTYLYGWSNTSGQYHVTFEPNGDTGYENGFERVHLFPTGAVGRTTYQTQTETKGSMQSVKTGYIENVGREKLTLAGVEYNAIKIVERWVEVLTPQGSSEVAATNTTDQIWWFVPSLGFNAKTTRDIVTETSAGERTHYSRSQTLSQIL